MYLWNSRLSSHGSSSYKFYVLVSFLGVLLPLCSMQTNTTMVATASRRRRHIGARSITASLFQWLRWLKYTITAQRRVVISINNRICIRLCCTSFLLSSIYRHRSCLLQFNTCIPYTRIRFVTTIRNVFSRFQRGQKIIRTDDSVCRK